MADSSSIEQNRQELPLARLNEISSGGSGNKEVAFDVSVKDSDTSRPDSARTATLVVVAAADLSSKPLTSSNSRSGLKTDDSLREDVVKRQFSGTKEQIALAIFVVLLCASCILSIIALCGRSQGWISSESNGSLKIGWGKGCLGEKAENPSLCSSSSSFYSLGDVLSSDTDAIGKAIVCLLIAAWVVPITVFLLVNRFHPNDRETCCHGYTISFLWSSCGLTLIILGVLFILSSQAAADRTKEAKLDVYCKGLRVCRKVGDVSECSDVTCRITSLGNVFCADHGLCQTREVELTCEDDGVVCDLVPDWALFCLFASSTIMIFLGVAVGLGSVFIGKEL